MQVQCGNQSPSRSLESSRITGYSTQVKSILDFKMLIIIYETRACLYAQCMVGITLIPQLESCKFQDFRNAKCYTPQASLAKHIHHCFMSMPLQQYAQKNSLFLFKCLSSLNCKMKKTTAKNLTTLVLYVCPFIHLHAIVNFHGLSLR